MNQKTALLTYLKRNPRGITIWTAMEMLGIARLSERIRELEAEGVQIRRQAVVGEGLYGNTVRVIRYKLA